MGDNVLSNATAHQTTGFGNDSSKIPWEVSTPTDIPSLEAEIDRLVYALYNLTDEEIALVGGKR